jgi:hypothetical protein
VVRRKKPPLTQLPPLPKSHLKSLLPLTLLLKLLPLLWTLLLLLLTQLPLLSKLLLKLLPLLQTDFSVRLRKSRSSEWLFFGLRPGAGRHL